jgi:hypothetical protein
LNEKSWEYGKEFLMAFTDHKKASDSVKKEEIFKVRKKQELHQTF